MNRDWVTLLATWFFDLLILGHAPRVRTSEIVCHDIQNGRSALYISLEG